MASKKKRHSSSKTKTQKKATLDNLIHSELVEVRNSPIHGRGVYAVKPIKSGTRVYEYVGERITHSEADRRFWKKHQEDGHTFLFVVNRKTVIDGTRKGNDARYINHRCEANCETVTEDNRIFIEAIRNIKAGEELGYDYQLTWSEDDTAEDLALYRCLCGSKKCRGTMLDEKSIEQHLADDRARRKRAKARAAKQGQASVKSAKKKSKVIPQKVDRMISGLEPIANTLKLSRERKRELQDRAWSLLVKEYGANWDKVPTFDPDKGKNLIKPAEQIEINKLRLDVQNMERKYNVGNSYSAWSELKKRYREVISKSQSSRFKKSKLGAAKEALSHRGLR